MNDTSTSVGAWRIVYPPPCKVRTDQNPALAMRFASDINDARTLHALATAIDRSQAKILKR